MSDDLLLALGARVSAQIGLKSISASAAETKTANSTTAQTVADDPPVKPAADGGKSVSAELGALLQNGDDFDDYLEESIGRIGKSISKLFRQLDRLEDRVERIGERLQRDLSRDINAGNFEDRTPDKAISKALNRLGRLEQRADRLADRVQDLREAISTQRAPSPQESAAVSISFSQSVTLSVENLQVNIGDGDDDDDDNISVSYTKIAFSLTTSVSLSVAQGNTQAIDLEGRPADLTGQNSGLYLDAENKALGALTNQSDDDAEDDDDDEALPATESSPLAAYDSETDRAAVDALLLVLDVNRSSSFSVAGLVLNAGAQFGPRFEGIPSFIDQILEPAEGSFQSSDDTRLALEA